MHNASTASTVIHLLGGLDGTGGLSIIGVLARDVSGAIPQWIAIHVVDNHQVQDLADSKSFVAYKVCHPCSMVTNVVYAVIVRATNAQATWNSAHTIAYTGPIRRISYLCKYGGVEQAALRTGRSPNGGSKLISITRNDDDSAEPACSSAPYSAQDAYAMCQNDLPIRNRDSMPAISIKDT